jgi:acyl carrier protein
MNPVTAQDVRSVLLAQLVGPLSARGLRPEQVPDHFDLLTEGILDSMGIVEVIGAIEQHFQIQIDFEDLDPENLTIVGPFCEYIQARCATNVMQRGIASNTDGQSQQMSFHAPTELGR